MRKKIVAGNWKMNKTLEDGLKLTSEILNMVKDEVHNNAQVVICPPFPYVYGIGKLLQGSALSAGAQNCYNKESGAFTGEVSAEMIASVGARYVILGHSERREYFKESNQMLAEKVNLVLKHGLTPIFCCGESLEQREKGIHIDFVNNQLTESLFHLPESDILKVVIAYEPIWAIGTGKTASSAQAQEMHEKIRGHIASKYGDKVAGEISILYGGSCNPGNAKELFACKDVDGGLIGGASLKSRDFVDIIKAF